MQSNHESLSFADRLEETVIAVLFATLTLVTFCQVIGRYVYNSGAVWALELTTTLFAWLVLFGVSYGIKRSSHMGIDAFVQLFPTPTQRLFGLSVVGVAIAYALFVLWGSYEYVGKLFRIGIYSVDLPVPRWVPLTIIPIGMLLMIYRLVQVGGRIYRGEQMTMLADEAKDTIEELGDIAGDTKIASEIK